MPESFENRTDANAPSNPVLRKDLAVPPEISFPNLSENGMDERLKIPEMLLKVATARVKTKEDLEPIRRMAGAYEYKEGRTEAETAFFEVLKEAVWSTEGNPNAVPEKDDEAKIPILELFDKAEWLGENGSFIEMERVLSVAATRTALLSEKIQAAYLQSKTPERAN